MTIKTLKLPESTTPRYFYKVILDSSEYTLYFTYIVRDNLGWHLSIYDNEDVVLLSNMKLSCWFNILSPYTRESLPKGYLGLLSTKRDFPECPELTLENLSTDFSLIYSAS